MRTRHAWGWIAVAGAVLACGGCGFKGPLYLPERNATVVTHPPQSAQAAPASGQTKTQTQTPAGKSKGKNAAPAGSPQAAPPQNQPPPPQ